MLPATPAPLESSSACSVNSQFYAAAGVAHVAYQSCASWVLAVGLPYAMTCPGSWLSPRWCCTVALADPCATVPSRIGMCVCMAVQVFKAGHTKVTPNPSCDCDSLARCNVWVHIFHDMRILKALKEALPQVPPCNEVCGCFCHAFQSPLAPGDQHGHFSLPVLHSAA